LDWRKFDHAPLEAAVTFFSFSCEVTDTGKLVRESRPRHHRHFSVAGDLPSF